MSVHRDGLRLKLHDPISTSFHTSDSEDESEKSLHRSARSSSKCVCGDYAASSIGTAPEVDTRTHVVVELYDTERSYVEALEILVKKYLQPLKSPENSGLVDSFLVDEIFYQVPAILAVHEVFLEELRKRLEQWDVQQKIGDIFINVFAKPSVMETYMSFINNWKKAKETVKATSASRPAFARFLEARARDHKGKLTLDNLLIKPVQKFPRYEMLIQRLIKHTDSSHPDHRLLLDAQREIHDLLVKINCTERESLEIEQQQLILRDLESVVDGLGSLVAPDRVFLRHDTICMQSGQGTTKERALFLFNDLLLITSIKRRTGTIKKPIISCQSNLASILEANKFKLLMRISLGDLEVIKAKDENVRGLLQEMETLTEDINTLTQISELAAALHTSHLQLQETVREMLQQMHRQLAERRSGDSRLCYAEMSLNTANGVENITFVFSKPEKKSNWEEAFTESKQKLALSDDKRTTPEFLSPVPIRKTRAGLQFTCAAPTAPIAPGQTRDVWVCNSDGYVGQVCVLTLSPKPQVTSCNGVCNARILCVACVPPATHLAPLHSAVVRQQTIHTDTGSSSVHSSFSSTSTKPGISISHADDGPKNIRLDSLSSSDDDDDGSSTSENQESNADSRSHDGTTTSSTLQPGKSGHCCSLNSSFSSTHSKSLSTPHSAGTSPHPVMKSNSNPAVDKQAMGINSGTLSSPASRQSSEDSSSIGQQPTMWLGTEDGCIHLYNCNDNIRLKKNKVKLQHTSSVHSILYFDNKVFVALGNGDLVVYVRDIEGMWAEHVTLSIGTSVSPISKLLVFEGKLWCAQNTNIKIIDTSTIQIEDCFQVCADTHKPISHMAVWGSRVWFSLQHAALLRCLRADTRELVAELNITPAVTKMLQGCDDIIRQHKAACLRVTSLLACRDVLWVGTSAGVLLTANLSLTCTTPQLNGVPYGHTGHVRFLTIVENMPQPTAQVKPTFQTPTKAKIANRRSMNASASATKTSTDPPSTADVLIISGGDGFEDFRNNSTSEDAGREDSTNHLLLWKM